MKSILTTVLAMLLVVSLSACTITDSEIQKPSEVSINNTSGEEAQSGNTNSEESKKTEQPQDKTATITETVLLDEAGVKITAKSLSTESLFGPEIKLLIENNSGKDLTFQSRNASVNGYMVETMMSVDVVDGKKANDSLTFSNSDLAACGISSIADMEFSFHIFTTSDWETYLDTPQIQIKTSIADSYEYTFDDSGDIAYNANDIKIVIKGLSEDDSIFGPGIVVFIENNSDKNITVQTRDVSLNGFMVEPIFSSDIMVGKCAVDSITFMSSELEENEITAIETVELSFHIFESDGWDDIADTDVITIKF